MIRPNILVVLSMAGVFVLGGCAVGKLLGGMAQNAEYQKEIEVHPVYSGLENKSVAVIVDVDLAILYEYPDVAMTLSANIARRVQANVPGISVLAPSRVSQWQFRTPQWNAMQYSEIAERLNVDRVVHVDIYEYRLHPPGNQWLWDGVCAANVGIIERDGYDPDNYVDRFNISVAFPDMTGVTRENATAGGIQTALWTLFIRETSWLFYTHLEPKHPKYFNGQIKEGRYDG
jgi:hypothetical protein